MNTVKKLLIVALFGLSIQPLAQAYNVAQLEAEATQVLDFADTCEQNGPESEKIAEWLKNKITSSASIRTTSDINIITTAKIINASTSMDTKIDFLSKQMMQEAADFEKAVAECIKQEIAEENRSAALFIASVCVIGIIGHMTERHRDPAVIKQVLSQTKWSEIFKKKLFAQ